VESGQTGQNIAHQLVDDARDILAVALDAKVGFTYFLIVMVYLSGLFSSSRR
jgi:hypothetical protein